MSEEEQRQSTLISRDEIEQALNARNSLLPCPACGEGPWVIFEGRDQSPSIGLIEADGSYQIPPRAIPVAMVICKHCGFIRLHATRVLQGFLNKTNTNLDLPADEGDDSDS